MDKCVSWDCHKSVDLDKINEKISECIESKHFTNNGKNVIDLQKKIHKIFCLDDDKEVLLVCNGSMGLNALIGGLNIHLGKKLRFAVQAFTYPCSVQGLLKDSLILDTDDNMGPNIFELEKHVNEYDGILITNCFGSSTNIDMYEQFSKINNKILLFDNASASYTVYNGKNHLNYGMGCMVSLQHSTPIGFGEGGFIVFDKIYLESMKRAICFGYTDTNIFDYNVYASNYKMSEIAAIYMNQYLYNLKKIYNHHIKMLTHFISKLKDTNLNVKILKNYSNYEESLFSNIPIIFPVNISAHIFIKNNIEAKKYYYPLNINCNNSMNLFNKIICLPLNLDVNETIIDKYIDIISEIMSIFITKAKYGIMGKYVDVTNVVNEKIMNNDEYLLVCNDLFTDPAPGDHKHLIIEKGNNTYTFGEFSTVNLKCFDKNIETNSKEISFAIVMGTYGRKNNSSKFYLERSIQSVLNQNHQNWILIVVSDKYEPESELDDIISKFNDNRIVLLKNYKVERECIKNRLNLWCVGGSTSTNMGLQYARDNNYKYYCHLDDDDFWKPEHLSMLADVYSKYPNCIFANTKSTYGTGTLPKHNVHVYENNFLPIPGGIIHSSLSFRCDIIQTTYFTSFVDIGDFTPADYQVIEYIFHFLRKNKQYCSIYVDKLTCFHDEEGFTFRS